MSPTATIAPTGEPMSTRPMSTDQAACYQRLQRRTWHS